MSCRPRAEFYRRVAPVRLKAFTEDFYRKVLRQSPAQRPGLACLRHQTDNGGWRSPPCSVPDVTTRRREKSLPNEWIRENLGVDVPVHFTAFHPDYKMMTPRLHQPPRPEPADAAWRRPALRHRKRSRCRWQHLVPRLPGSDRSRLVFVRHYALAETTADKYGYQCLALTTDRRTHWGQRRLPC